MTSLAPSSQISWSYADLRQLWASVNGPAEWADTMAAVALAESGGCRYALAGPLDIRPVKTCPYRLTLNENSIGLWQINVYAHQNYNPNSLFDPIANARAAVAILGAGPPTAWSTYQDGSYKSYLGGRGAPGGADNPFPSEGPPGLTGPVGIPKHLTSAWHTFTMSLAHTLPTQMRRAQVAQSRYKYAVRGKPYPRLKPPGVQGPVR